MLCTEEFITEANRRSWNRAAGLRSEWREARQRTFLEGGSTLFPEERELLGDVRDKALAQILCRDGLDALSVARDQGAQVVGMDPSEEAMERASALARENGLAASFRSADLLPWLDSPGVPRMDVVFSSYGVIPWIADLDRWARGVERLLVPGGRLVLIDYHPLVFVFDDLGDSSGRPVFDYMGGTMAEEVDGVAGFEGLAGVTASEAPAREGVSRESGEWVSVSGEDPCPAYSFA